MSQDFTIVDVAYRGAGIAKDGGIVTFIPGTLPGEKVRAEITADKKRFREARLVEVLAPSPDRIEPCCRLADGRRVPGCVYDHVAYPAEVALKDAQLRNFLRKLAPSPDVFLAPFASPAPLHYRNKVVFHAQRGAIGYLGDDNRTVVDIESCPLANTAINFVWSRMRDRMRQQLKDGDTITFRHTEADGVASWVNRAPQDAPWLTEKSAAGELTLPPDAFFQVNPQVASALVGQVRDWLREAREESGADLLLDLYCGVGVFALAAASLGFSKIIGIESGRSSIAAARRNATRLGIESTVFGCGTVADAAKARFGGADLTPAIAVADPPRNGMEPIAVETLARSSLRNFIYVSCDPATLTRDLATLAGAGFSIRRARMFDMFPRTLHFESALWLSRS